MNPHFQFKRFTVYQNACAMKVSTDACAFGAWAGQRIPSSTHHILDIGTGTGLLSLMLAQATEAWNPSISAIELDPAAAEQATCNVLDSPWATRIQVVHGDISTHPFPDQFDGIICNPPFYKNDLKPSNTSYLQAHHEHSLTAEQLFERAEQLASASCWLAILIPPNRMEDYEVLAHKHHWTIEENTTLRHSQNHPPLRQFLWLTRGAFSKSTRTVNTLFIYQNTDNYSTDFHHLLQPFYLKF